MAVCVTCTYLQYTSDKYSTTLNINIDLYTGEMDAREINIQVPPKQGAEKGQGVIDLSNPTQMASEVFRFANGGKGMIIMGKIFYQSFVLI